MQKNLINVRIAPHLTLQLRHRGRHINPHTRWAADKHTRPASKLPTDAPKHKRDIRASVLSAPATLFHAHGWQKGESHEVLLQHSRCRGESEIKVSAILDARVAGGGDMELEVGFVADVRFWWGSEIWLWEVGDGVLVLAAEFALFFGVAASFVADQRAVALTRNALKRLVDFVMQNIADRAGGRGGLRVGAGLVPLCGCDEELTLHCLRGRIVAANFKLFLEPFHRFGPFERPDYVHVFGDGFAVAHLLDEVQELADDCGDAAAAGKEDYCVKGGEVALHAAVGTVDESSVCLVRTFLDGGVESFPGEPSEGSEYQSHVPVLLTVIGGEVVAT